MEEETTIDYIPSEIMTEILSYLPLEERDDKRKVNKLWRDIISTLSPTFFSSEDEKEFILNQALDLGILVYFSRFLIPYHYNDEMLTINILDKGKVKESLYFDPYDEELGLDEIEEDKKEDINYDYIVEIISLLMKQYPNLNLGLEIIQNENWMGSIQEIRMAFRNILYMMIQKDNHRLEKEYPLMEEVMKDSILGSYKSKILSRLQNIVKKTPKYILNDPKLLNEYLDLLFIK